MRWLSSSTDDANRVPCLTASRKRSIERKGRALALTATRWLTLIHSVAISDGSKVKS